MVRDLVVAHYPAIPPFLPGCSGGGFSRPGFGKISLRGRWRCETIDSRRIRPAWRSARAAESTSLLMRGLGKLGPRVQIPPSPPVGSSEPVEFLSRTPPDSDKLSVSSFMSAFVAQRIEHLITDQKVGGSSPSERTKFLAPSSTDGATCFCALLCEHRLQARCSDNMFGGRAIGFVDLLGSPGGIP
jgi:hypothetical protein